TEGIENEMYESSDYKRMLKNPHDPYNVFQLYNWYLWNSPTRENPFYMNTGRNFVEHMATKNVQNVGILAAHVDMKKDQIQFIKNEREFRVKPSAIISIDKLIH